MPIVRVVTTASCAQHLQIGNHVYEPAQSREIDMTDDELATLKQHASKADFSAIGLVGAAAAKPTSAVAVEPEAAHPSKHK